MTIQATIVMGHDSRTWASGETIEEVLEKIKQFHTMSEFEKNHYTKKGQLEDEIASGWWLKEKNT